MSDWYAQMANTRKLMEGKMDNIEDIVKEVERLMDQAQPLLEKAEQLILDALTPEELAAIEEGWTGLPGELGPRFDMIRIYTNLRTALLGVQDRYGS